MYGELFVDDMSDLVFQALEYKDDDETVCIVAKYDEAVDIIKELMQYDEIIPYSLELHDEEFNGYGKEYLIVVSDDDVVFCEPAFENGHYLNVGTEYENIFILENCNSKIIKDCPDENVHVVIFGDVEDEEEDACDGCCEKCKLAKDEDTYSDESTYISISKDHKGNPTGFTKSWFTNEDGVSAYSSYSFHCDDDEMLKEIAKDFGVVL